MKKILRVRSCPSCKGSWVDSEPHSSLSYAYESGGFLSGLYGAGEGLWKCPHCARVFSEKDFE